MYLLFVILLTVTADSPVDYSIISCNNVDSGAAEMTISVSESYMDTHHHAFKLEVFIIY